MNDGPIKFEVREGLPYPLGAKWDGKGVNFALFSANATRVEVCLFDDAGKLSAGAFLLVIKPGEP